MADNAETLNSLSAELKESRKSAEAPVAPGPSGSRKNAPAPVGEPPKQ